MRDCGEAGKLARLVSAVQEAGTGQVSLLYDRLMICRPVRADQEDGRVHTRVLFCTLISISFIC